MSSLLNLFIGGLAGGVNILGGEEMIGDLGTDGTDGTDGEEGYDVFDGGLLINPGLRDDGTLNFDNFNEYDIFDKLVDGE